LIISASRRTDIPAFYSEWLFNRLKEGFALVRNPMNYHQVSRINLSKEVVDCIVFWTKDPGKMIPCLDSLKDYNYYFQYTLNPYDQTIECNVLRKTELIKSFIELANKLGSHRVIWRYDPIIISDLITKEYHYHYFDYIASRLSGYTERCVISFLDLYKKTERNMKGKNVKEPRQDDIIEIAGKLVEIAAVYKIKVETCSEGIELGSIGINHGKCIDDELISRIIGVDITVDQDKNQRKECGCVSSIDIGAYNTCHHYCAYCYANTNKPLVQKNKTLHDPRSPLLLGRLEEKDRIYEREAKSLINPQLLLYKHDHL